MEIKINHQEAYISTLQLNILFEIDSVEYLASGWYSNNEGIEDIDVVYLRQREHYNPGRRKPAPDKIYEAGKQLLLDMDVEKHKTFDVLWEI